MSTLLEVKDITKIYPNQPMHQPHNLVDITRAGDPNVRRLLAVHSLPWRGIILQDMP